MNKSRLAEEIKRLLPDEKYKRIRQAILLAATQGTTESNRLRQELADASRIKTGLLVNGEVELTTTTNADLQGFAWAIDYAVYQQSALEHIAIDAPDAAYPRPEIFVGKNDGSIEYRPGTIDEEGNAQDPTYDAATEVLLRAITRNPDNSTEETTPEPGTTNFVSKSDPNLQTIQSLLAFAQLARTEGAPARVPNISMSGQLGLPSSPALNDVYTTTFGGGGWSKLVTIHLNLPSQINYFVCLEFAGISTNYEKGELWVQFRVNSGTGDLEDNLLKCWGDMVPAKYKLVRLDANTYAVFANHDEFDSNYKFRPKFQYGNSTVNEYHHQSPRAALPAGDQYDFSLYGQAGDAAQGTWRFDTTTTDADPGAGKLRANHATIASATFLYFDKLTSGNIDASRFLSTLKEGDTIYSQIQADSDHYARWKVTGAAVDGTGYWKIPVEYISGGGTAPTNNKVILVRFNLGAAGAGGGVQSVTGDGVNNADPDNPVVEFPTPAEIGAQDDLGTNVNAAIAGANAPSGLNPLATMADVGGGGADSNAVHYNAADGKTASEKKQARDNIGLDSGAATVLTDTGVINRNNIARPTNLIIYETATSNMPVTGFVAGEHNEKLFIYVNSPGSTWGITLNHENASSAAANRLSLPNGVNITIVQYQFITLRYDAIVQRWLVDGVQWNLPNIFTENIIFETSSNAKAVLVRSSLNTTSIERFGVYYNTSSKLISAKGSGVEFGTTVKAEAALAATGTARSTFTHNGLSSGNGAVDIQVLNTGRAFTCRDSSSTYIFIVDANGRVEHTRSNAAANSLIRSEHRLYYLVSVTTSGSIADQALTEGVFNYRFTAATSISGFANGEIGRTIDIDNASGATLTLLHENAGSIAANRIKLIGAADLVIPIDGKVTLKYCTGSRWELVSKNF